MSDKEGLLKPNCRVSEIKSKRVRCLLRNLFRGLIKKGILRSNEGMEMSEQLAEHMYDRGLLKFSLNPTAEDDGLSFSVLSFDPTSNGYNEPENIKIITM